MPSQSFGDLTPIDSRHREVGKDQIERFGARLNESQCGLAQHSGPVPDRTVGIGRRRCQHRTCRERVAGRDRVTLPRVSRCNYGVKRSLVARAGVALRPPMAYTWPPTPPTPSAARAVGIAPRLVHVLATGS